jgi:Lrp/AsnC family transcriptional regulator, leucine-responsive regulatory protein
MSSEADHGGIRVLDETDVRILRLLEANGRISYEEVGRFVHLSANAVRGRVQGLTRRGVIRGIHADVDWEGGGGPRIEALVDIRLRAHADHAAFEHDALALPGTVTLEHLAGPIHYQLRLAVTSMEALDVVLTRLQHELHAETNTKIVTRTLRSGRPSAGRR